MAINTIRNIRFRQMTRDKPIEMNQRRKGYEEEKRKRILNEEKHKGGETDRSYASITLFYRVAYMKDLFVKIQSKFRPESKEKTVFQDPWPYIPPTSTGMPTRV